MSDYSGLLWGLMTIVGPLLLLAAFAYGVIVYRRRSHASKQHTQQATRDLYERTDRQEKREAANLNSPPIAPGRQVKKTPISRQ